MKSSFAIAIAGALVAAAAAPDAAAQYRLPTLVSSIRADSLHEAAAALIPAHRWGDAARLHRRSAELRPAEDPQVYRCLLESAALAWATKDRSAARKDLTRAAENALARGDLRSAALAYVDAAWIAQEQKDRGQVWELAHRAEMLADSPLLGVADRQAILKRISRAPEAVRMAMEGR